MSESKPSHVIFVGDEKQQTHFVINPPGADPRDELIKKLVVALEVSKKWVDKRFWINGLPSVEQALAEAKQLGYGE